MKKSFLRIAAAGLIALLLCTLSLSVFAEERSYSILLEPDLSKTDGVFSTYIVTFSTPRGVLYQMDAGFFFPYISEETKAIYPQVNPATAWSSGLLTVYDQEARSAFLSAPSAYSVAELLYPVGNAAGSTKNIYQAYPFKDDHLYTMVLHTWEEPSRQGSFPSTSKELLYPVPEDPAPPTTTTPKDTPPGRKIGVGVMVLFFAAGILAALGGVVGMIKRERSTSRTDDG